MAVKFETKRTIQALQAKLVKIRATAPQQINLRMRGWEPWTIQQEAWLVQKAAGLLPPAVDWNKMASLFETRFGFRRATLGLRGKYSNKLHRSGDLTGYKHVMATPAANYDGERSHG